MNIQHNFLRVFRKRTQLTQLDVASVLKTSDYANVSRWENGIKKPAVEVLLSYHLLFGVPVEQLFERQKEEIRTAIVPRIHERVAYLKTLPDDLKTQSRINYLAGTAARLTQ